MAKLCDLSQMNPQFEENLIIDMVSNPGKYEAIVYGWINTETGERYIGYHKTSEMYDTYRWSADNSSMNEAWTNGNLRKVILYRGTVSESITLERWFLKFVDARRNDTWYNKSNGGGEGLVADFSNLTEEMKKIGLDWLRGIDPPVTLVKTAINHQLAKKIAAKTKNNEFEIVRVETDKIYFLERIQVRQNKLIPSHVDKLVDKMRDPSSAKEHIRPIVVCVFPDGSRKVIDGNHTIEAAYRVGYTHVDVIYIDSAELEDSMATIRCYGLLMNDEPKLKWENQQEDFKFNIKQYILDGGSPYSSDSDEFKQEMVQVFADQSKMISQNKVVKCLQQALIELETEWATANLNFSIIPKNEKGAMLKAMERADPLLAVIGITAGTCYNSGIGAINNKIGELKKTMEKNQITGEIHGKILIHYSSYAEWKNRADITEKLQNAMDVSHFRLSQEHRKIIQTLGIETYDVEYEFINPFPDAE
jgi:hypothetical protein